MSTHDATPTPDPREQYRFTSKQAAEYLAISQKALFRLVERKAIDHLRVFDNVITRVVDGKVRKTRNSGPLRFSQAGLDAWIESRRVRPVTKQRPASSASPLKPRISQVELPKVLAFS